MFYSWVGKTCWRRDRLPTTVFLGFPCGSAGKECACNMGDLGLIPGLGRSPREGKGYALQYSGLAGNSQNCLFLKSLCGRKGFPCGSASKESACNAEDLGSIPGLGRSPGEGNSSSLQYSGLENSMDCIVHGGHKESDTTERLSLSLCGRSTFSYWYLP